MATQILISESSGAKRAYSFEVNDDLTLGTSIQTTKVD